MHEQTACDNWALTANLKLRIKVKLMLKYPNVFQTKDNKECCLNFQVPEEKCVSVPKEECKQVPKEECKQVPKQACTPVYVCQVCQAPTYAAGRR
jgi:hypothetical protein